MPNLDQSALIGHAEARDYFARLAENGHAAHAYLLVGMRFLGKRTLAEEIAAQVLGVSREELEKQADFRALLGTERIKVDEIRQLQGFFAHSSFGGGKKVALLANCERLTTAAQNALLKTLEEPSGDSLLLLTTAQEECVLPTIRSRCQIIHLHPVERDTIFAALESRTHRDEASLYTRLAAGRPGVAFSLLEEEWRNNYFEARTSAWEFLALPADKRLVSCSSLAKKENRDAILDQILFFLHDLQAIEKGHEGLVVNQDLLDDMVQLGQMQGGANWSKGLAAWLDMRQSLDRHINPTLAIESLALSLSSL
jgi:DNA polymerase-3 subunit delta'